MRLLLLLTALSLLTSGAADDQGADDAVFGRWIEDPRSIKDVRVKLKRGDILVPIIGVQTSRDVLVRKRRAMFAAGVYPGVEYVVQNITMRGDTGEQKDVESLRGMLAREQQQPQQPQQPIRPDTSSPWTDEDRVVLTVAPNYKLVDVLEREWPVEVPLSTLPYVITRGMYNSITAVGSASLALSFLMAAVVATQIFTFSFVNSRSMTPTIVPGDLILVEKVSPFVRKAVGISPALPSDVVFFSAPPQLLKYIEEQRGPADSAGTGASVSASTSTSTSADAASPPRYRNLRPITGNTLLVKRVSSIDQQEIGGGTCLNVRGDNPEVSLDSRQWGCLDPSFVVGRPLLRVLPFSRIGPL